MSKNQLAIFFSIFFLSLTTAPTIVMVVDDSMDVSFLYDISEEEEEKKGKDKNKEFEKFLIDSDKDLDDFPALKKANNLDYAYKTYPKPHLNLIFPPPEFIS
ncbi:hypothetical protein [Psychroserpens luteolus]|uniref:hypothetical protein n=1 Tax=Psychroserpens luteolus TaxID=2855840 RepID=UPI001E3673CF|nr:hypothetical protein [Psychroserpens luteolus]MCD2258493.1 hypothetical protein [Psychroserpens luteolus]